MIVIGAGRVGQALAARDATLRLIDRAQGWGALDEAAGEPIFIATRNDDLAAVLDKVPEHRRADLVFTQNGMLRDFLAQAGLAQATRGLLFFAVPSRGAPLSPGGESPFWGPKAEAVVEWCVRHEVPAAAVEAEAFAALELEKLIWNCAFGLMCEAHDKAVGAVVHDHRAQLDALVAELAELGAGAMGLLPAEVDALGLAERCCAYSLSIPTYKGAVKEWQWRNGWFVQRSAATGGGAPVHEALLAEVGRG